MKTITITDSNGTKHNFNPKYVVDYYTVPAKDDLIVVTLIFSEDSGIHPNIFTKVCTKVETVEVLSEIKQAIDTI